MQNLDYLIKSIGISIRTAQEETEKFSLACYKEWFTEEVTPEGGINLKPKTICVALPSGENTYEKREIPIIALLNHHSLALEETRIRMSMVSRWDDNQQQMVVEMSPLTKDSDDSAITADRCEVELVFKRNPTGEGVSRYVDKFIRNI